LHMIKTITLLLTLVVTVLAVPATPSCPFSVGCYYVWVANYVPSTNNTQFSFFVDGVAVATSVNYAASSVIPLACNSSVDPGFLHEFGVGPTWFGQTVQTPINNVICNVMYAFFASRTTNSGTTEVYSIGWRAMKGSNPGYFSGLVFNGIYRGGALNAAFCEYDNNPQCDNNNRNQRQNRPATVGVWFEMDMRTGTNYGNPVTLTGDNIVFYDDTVSGAQDGLQAWIFYGDNQQQNAFPLSGGISSASFLTISMSVVVVLNAIALSMF